jgi:hypothetical protein
VFEKSPFKKFSVQAPTCERPKTAQRTLFMSFEINNCFPVTHSVELRHSFHTILSNETSVLYILPDILEDGENRLSLGSIAIGTLASLQ